MIEQTTSIPETTSDERLFGLLSHLSIFIGGIVLPIIIWATQKEKSKFVKFHSLQAIFFQLSLAVLVIIIVILFLIVLFISGIGLGGFENSGETMSTFMVILFVLFYGGMFLLIIGGMAYSIYLGVKTYNGYLIRIPFIGNIVYKKVYEQS